MELIPVQWITWTMHLKKVITIKKKQLDLITVKRSFFWKETLSYYRLIYLGYYERSKKQILWEKSWCLKLVFKQNPFIVKIQTVIVRRKDPTTANQFLWKRIWIRTWPWLAHVFQTLVPRRGHVIKTAEGPQSIAEGRTCVSFPCIAVSCRKTKWQSGDGWNATL